MFYKVSADETTMAVGALVAVLIVLHALTFTLRVRWAARDIPLGMPIAALVATQTVLGLAVGIVVNSTFSTFAAVAASAFTWLAVLTVSTDLANFKVPREACNTTALIGFVCFALTYSPIAAISLGVTLIALWVIPVVLRAVTRTGLGFGDIRLLLAASATLSWWVGEAIMLWALIAACFLQIIFRVITYPWRSSIGRYEQESDGETSPPINPEVKVKRPRRMLPMGPAIVVGFILAIAYATLTSGSSCIALSNTVGCF